MQTKILNSFINRIDPSSTASIQLKPGQIFHGKITQLYTGSLAKLQVGQMQLTAQLEAQLEKGEKYWFRVAPGEGIPRLKVIENVSSATAQKHQSVQQILQQMGLQVNNQNEKMIQFLSQQNLPFTKQNVINAAPLLLNSPLPEKDTLQLLSSMMQRQLPISRDSFHALASLQNQLPLAEAMNQLAGALRANNIPGTMHLQQQLTSLQQTGQGNAPAQLKEIMQFISGSNTEAREQMVQVLQRLGITNQNTFNELIQQFKDGLLKQENFSVIKDIFPGALQRNGGSISIQQLSPLQVFDHFIKHLQLPSANSALQLLQLLGVKDPPQAMQSLQNFSREAVPENFRGFENALKAVAVPVTDTGGATSVRSSEQLHPLRVLMQQLGLNYESSVRSMLQNGSQQEAQQAASLKANLLNMLQNTQLPQGIKEQADFLLNRITGMQIVNQEQQGPLQHLLIQLPIASFDKFQDITIQWSGKENAEGTMDENHCRILFYLHLENLKELVIDVQIQNRIVTVNVFNENKKPVSVEKVWGPILTEKLLDMNYHLSSIQWKLPREELIKEPVNSQIQSTDYKPYKGVDYRI
ncbi:hypothetical protein [Alkalicoccus daliensis]|uniref:Flagellar hook-length control protein FliK n=1 Tax=Alkalicoccus daliensis TaxID=745820 RepID=A0A1H0A218_9BACI|nr:hypothetical protein [Alkalicoccus daliensis]SDN27457.1 hypothetical protein SAMN04488053_101321 [Alkalicoccus daliensis]